MKCTLCKLAVGAAITVALAAILYSIISSGGGAWPVWIKFITALGAKWGIEGAALKTLGYKVFSALVALGAALVYLISDLIAWLICKVCMAIGACKQCPPSPF
ncbi:MAG: hypothetical protein L0Y32_02545 [Nevskiales bacterium]|nr:hypothetical protein [Nevskiales bacterium]